MHQSYKKLATEFYDCIKPRAEQKELSFYTDICKQANGPVLEAMCGSGRLLLPLLKSGFAVDGLDCSAAMLQKCKERLAMASLSTNLYLQELQECSLENKYAAIFIAYGSFQLLYPQTLALKALGALKQHLLPGGTLILDTFIPWDVINSQQTVFYSERTVTSDTGTILLTMQGHLHKQRQTYTTYSRYLKTTSLLQETEEEERVTTWYYDNELRSLLEQAGFTTITSASHSFSDGDQSLIYQAS